MAQQRQIRNVAQDFFRDASMLAATKNNPLNAKSQRFLFITRIRNLLDTATETCIFEASYLWAGAAEMVGLSIAFRRCGLLFAMLSFLAGCGAVLPVMKLQYSTEERFKDFVKGIASHVKCELANAVAREYSPYDPKRKGLFKWAARVALTIRANDKGDLNPGVSIFNTGATRTLGLGGAFETNGTREITMTYYLPFDELLEGKRIALEQRRLSNCNIVTSETGIYDVIAGDLGIHETLKAAFETWDSGLTLSERIKGGPFDTITHHVTFQVIAGGSTTPTWKLVNVTANSTTPFLSATRTTTDELLITVGPKALGDRKELDTSFGIERLRSVISRP